MSQGTSIANQLVNDDAVRLALTTNPTNMLMRDINMLVDAGKKLAELAPLVKAII
jgi:hypothetical protein